MWQYGKDKTEPGEWGAGRVGGAILHRFTSEGPSKRRQLSRELKARKRDVHCQRGEDRGQRTNSKLKALRKNPGGSVSGAERRGQGRKFERLHEAHLFGAS